MSLVIPEKFNHILRVMNTNIDGKRKVMFALTAIKGIGRRFSNIVCKKADVDLNKRAGELSEEEVLLRVRGQHTKTTGRRGRTVGVSKKKG
ncbi:unnamed protein product [Oppiella nova]|uniref:Small ribosomal subunit protein uS13 n=1 Tax=Oppiella nova TaxID=334625 RepID=A0A7R9M7N3_9ACAR|nr:unnamed protein product [Oppiella nova]CAG2171120.1 unnamed protein product [Oppiella nova]